MLRQLRQWSTSSRRLGALFLVVLLPSAATLVWLGIQLLEQDRRLWADRDLERREAAADIIVRGLEQKIAAADAALVHGDVADGAVLATLAPTGVTVRPTAKVLWVPVTPAQLEANTTAFAEAEIAEIRQTGDRGVAVYSALRHASDPTLQAGALLRLARVSRTAGNVKTAIQHYRELANLTGVAFAGMPADLLARRAVCELLQESPDSTAFAHDAETLRADFLAGRWTLEKSAWTLTAGDIERWTGKPLDIPSDRHALTEAIAWLWAQLRVAPLSGSDATAPAARDIFRRDDVSILALWRPTGDSVSALFVPPSLARSWARDSVPTELMTADALVLTDEGGAIVAGSKAGSGTRLVTRLGAKSGLPWNVELKPSAAPYASAERSFRQRQLAIGLGAIVLLLAAGSYLLWRTVRREMAVARIQTDFVAAVSHEFRTPLTSLQHVTELLDEDDEIPRERRRSMYAALGRNTERLRGLVESLLDFARMEDGRRPYDLQPVDPSLLVRRVIDEFERTIPAERVVITPHLEAQNGMRCRADSAAIGRAVWNLLDNAVKYSPEPHLIDVSVRGQGDQIAISVADQGFGIPAADRQSVFRKFVRGSDMARRGIKGTGLGLAMVSHIVSAHDGRIELETEEGRGSTFTILLPVRHEA